MFSKNKKFTFHAHQYSSLNIAYKPEPKKNILKRLFYYVVNYPKKIKDNFKKNKFISEEIFAFLALALIAWAVLQSARLGAVALEIKQKILLSAGQCASFLQSAKTDLENREFALASEKLTEALKNFKNSQEELSVLEKNLLGATKLLPQQRDAQNFLKASVHLAEAAQAGLKFAERVKNFSFGATGFLRGQASLDDVSADLGLFENKLRSAYSELNRANIKSIPAGEREVVIETTQKIKIALKATEHVKELISLGKIFFEGKKEVLLLMQNYNELRPTGGFLGSYGRFTLEKGEIKNLKISSVYDLDGQLTEKILPPTPIFAVNDRWFLRDSNWFTSFEQSAKNITTFYEKEGGETPDLIIAITPGVIIELMKITGPLETENGLVIEENNLVEQLQILTQDNFDDPTNEPKKILGSLFTTLFQKIGALNAEKKGLLINALQQSLINKQAVLYSKENEAQKIFESFNWAGKITQADRDYLLISGANLGGTKTDLAIKQNITLESNVNEDGQIENTVKILRTNTMPKIRNTQNKSYLRIYVPKGSQFKEAKGFDYVNLKKEVIKDYKPNPQVFEWERNQVEDVTSGTLIGTESEKTFFGNWVMLEGGESREIVIKYTLPFKLKKVDRLSLLLQKQPGAGDFDFKYTLWAVGRTVKWKNSEGLQVNGNTTTVKTVLNKDLFFGMVLQKK